MAIQLNVDVAAAIKNLGGDAVGYEAKGVKFMPYTGGVKFVSDGEVLVTWTIAPVKLADMANKGYDPGNPLHETIKGNLTKALAELDAALGTAKAKPKAKAGVKINPTPGVAQVIADQSPSITMSGMTSSITATVVPAGASVPEYPPNQMKTGTKVALKDATALYQPVKGTSESSRYYAVGISPGLKVACRYQAASKELSVRVEGPSFAKMQQTLLNAGLFGPEFSGQFQGSYASMHIKAPSPVDVQKVVGAVISCLCSEIKHGVPSMDPIINAA